MNSYFILGLIIELINIACALSLVFIERREPETTWAWLLILIVLPGLGFLIYLALGQNLSREKIFKEKTAIDVHKSKNLTEEFNISLHRNTPAKNYTDLVKMNYNNSGAEFTRYNCVKTFISGEDKFSNLLEDIKKAEKFIHIEYYIFRMDGLGRELISLLNKKVDDGVEVRLLVDGMGSRGLRGKNEDYIKSLGIKFAIFFPGLTKLVNLRINYRNHRKIVVIDGQIGYVGGFNVGDEYINKGTQFNFWRDTHLRIQGDAVKELNKRFALDWDYAANDSISQSEKYFPSTINDGNVGVQIVSSGPDHIDEYIKYNYLKIITNAKKYIYIQTPYLVLDRPMIEALKISALSGVDIRIIVPGSPDHFFMEWALSANIGNLIECGIKFYRYQNGFIHSKTIVADDSVCSVGTANLDIRSFKLNFEINAIIYDDIISMQHKDIFISDQKKCQFLTIEKYNNRSTCYRICESIIRLISPIL
ncbi:cardiolipin synthase [Clostridium sp. ATCC 25772]|uniref:cardiolipin synthase n=1 Tax=Clostridium sp. ATCC 25772 TaxID=1676991 RepID=UPI000781D048|nr:cardiolipin synthase [Clostridium sp. ATCC 25772]